MEKKSVLSLLLYIFFGYSQAQCDFCSWPYVSGVNKNGECYLAYQGSQPGFQSNLQVGCYLYCDAWAREISVQQTASTMLSFTENGGGVSCQCQRLNSSGDVDFKTRPTGSCDWGYSDKVQSHYDAIAVDFRSKQIDSSLRLMPSSNDVNALRQDAINHPDYYYYTCSHPDDYTMFMCT